MKKVALIALGCCFFLNSCSKTETSKVDNTPFLGTWGLSSIIYQGDIGMEVPSDITIRFNELTNGLIMDGQSVCNAYLGKVNFVDESILSFYDLGFTEVACIDDDSTSFEEYYFSLLPKIRKYGFERDGLFLSFDDTYLIFNRNND